MRLPALAFALLCFSSQAFAAGAKDLVNEMAVSVVNKSLPDLCAERCLEPWQQPGSG